ncbi:MAG: TIR domain-containing protein, partial [Lewinellaceae bacterium]|nr:TIR domain-containing protein [Lewinellaceae bacterium]
MYEQAKHNAHHEKLPNSWVQISQLLRELRKDAGKTRKNPFSAKIRDNAWMDYDDFASGCLHINDALNETELETLTYYLHQIGIIVWLPHIDRKVYTDPSWLTSKIYRVLNERCANKTVGSAPPMFKDFGNEIETTLLLDMMQEWEIIFPDNSTEGNWIAPQYLPEEHPMENLFSIALTGLQQQFFLVKAPLFHYRKMLRRLIFQFGNDPEVVNKEYWKNGILFVDQSSGIRVLLKGMRTPEEPDLGTIMICVEPDKASTADWQQKVFTALLMAFLNQSTPSVSGSDSSAPWLNMANTLRDEAEKQQELQIAINGSDFISLPTLLRSARAGISALITDDKKRIRLEDFNPLLAGLQISPPQPTIFFSYSHDDKDLRDELDKHLAPLRRRSKAKTWFDGAIGAGQNWEETIRKNLRSADVILLLISHNFIN